MEGESPSLKNELRTVREPNLDYSRQPVLGE